MKQNDGSTLVTVIVLVTILGIGASLFLSLQTGTIQSFKSRRAHLQTIAAVRSAVVDELLALSLNDTLTISVAETLFDEPDSLQDLDSRVEYTPFTAAISAQRRSVSTTVCVRAEVGSVYTPRETTVILLSEGQLIASAASGQKVSNGSEELSVPLRGRRSSAAKAKGWLDRQFALFPSSENPAVVRSQRDYANLPDTVKGSLFFDTGSGTMSIDADRRPIVVCGDLQFTGSLTLKGGSFIVAGEIRVSDKVKLQRTDLFTAGKVFFDGDCRFEGRVASLEVVEIFGNSEIKNGSLIVSWAGKASDSTATAGTRIPAVAVRENATVDGTLIAFGERGILTGSSTRTSGILWAKSWINHEGNHRGVVVAQRFIAPDAGTPQPEKGEINEIVGTVDPLFTRKAYPLPWFIGTPSLRHWIEGGCS